MVSILCSHYGQKTGTGTVSKTTEKKLFTIFSHHCTSLVDVFNTTHSHDS